MAELFILRLFLKNKAVQWSVFRHDKKWLVLLLPLFVGFAGGWLASVVLHGTGEAVLNDSTIVRQGGNYKFVNPLLFCNISENTEFAQFKPLKDQVVQKISEELKSDASLKVSVYYRDLNSGRWFGINENEKYSPASLLKVPLMIAFFKYAELHPDILARKVMYEGGDDRNKLENFKPEKSIQPGQAYSVAQLLEAMIVYSDNNARGLLRQFIDQDSLNEVYTDLGLSVPPNNQSSGVVDFMSAKSYSHFFRVLYNASYFNNKLSEIVLNMLSKARFPHGLAAGIPADVTIAQKFGERRVLDSDGITESAELHDCGVIYYPSHPYLMCVMTKGSGFDLLSKLIQDVSRVVYAGVDGSYRQK